MAKDKNKRTLLEKLRYKYRLIVINEDTFEQKTSLRLSRINIYSLVSVVIMMLTILVVSAIAFTPIKYYLPGVGSLDIRGQLTALEMKSDSLESMVEERNLWISNFQQIVSGEIDSTYFQSDSAVAINIDSIDLEFVSDEEIALREEMNLVNVVQNNGEIDIAIPSEVQVVMPSLISPIDGIVTETFSLKEDHLGIDVAGEEDAPIKAVASGTVIIADWNPSTGHVIGIQHSSNLISFYKHNSELLKKVGNFVEKGEAIAVIGNSGELTTGPHLHFELWQNGQAVDPLGFIFLEKLNPQ